jgi:hypothetical protein
VTCDVGPGHRGPGKAYHRASMSRTRAPSRRLVIIAGLTSLALALAVVITVVVVSQSAFSVRGATPGEAEARFKEVTRRFVNVPPLVEIVMTDGHRRAVVHPERRPTRPASLTVIRGLAWRASDGVLAEVRLPFWFVRMKLAGGRMTLGALLPEDWDVVRVDSGDLVRHGPGLLLDERSPNGNRLLLWAE